MSMLLLASLLHYTRPGALVYPWAKTGCAFQIEAGETLQLNCTAECQHGCRYKWFHPRGETDGRYLTIDNIGPEYDYIDGFPPVCVVWNTCGFAKSTVMEIDIVCKKHSCIDILVKVTTFPLFVYINSCSQMLLAT